MFSSNLPEPDLLKTLLEPLLEDFQYWFEQSCTLLKTHEMKFLGAEKQAELLMRVHQAQREISTAQMLLKVTEGQVGVETSVLVPWHQLVTECWQTAVRFRLEQSIE